MTTPERMRTRQRRLGIVMILLALFTVIQAVYFSVEDRAQRNCVEEKFSELSAALETRSMVLDTERSSTREVIQTYARAANIARQENRELTPQERKQLEEDMITALIDYDEETREVDRRLRNNPLPPYPVGVCQQ